MDETTMSVFDAIRETVAKAHPGLRVEIVDCPNVPPTLGVPSVVFDGPDDFAAAFDPIAATAKGNGELIQAYLKRRSDRVPNAAGDGFETRVRYVADFAVVK